MSKVIYSYSGHPRILSSVRIALPSQILYEAFMLNVLLFITIF